MDRDGWGCDALGKRSHPDPQSRATHRSTAHPSILRQQPRSRPTTLPKAWRVHCQLRFRHGVASPRIRGRNKTSRRRARLQKTDHAVPAPKAEATPGVATQGPHRAAVGRPRMQTDGSPAGKTGRAHSTSYGQPLEPAPRPSGKRGCSGTRVCVRTCECVCPCVLTRLHVKRTQRSTWMRKSPEIHANASEANQTAASE